MGEGIQLGPEDIVPTLVARVKRLESFADALMRGLVAVAPGLAAALSETPGAGAQTVTVREGAKAVIRGEEFPAPRPADPLHGARVRSQVGATGRYIGDGLVLLIDVRDGSLLLDAYQPGVLPDWDLSLPSDEAVDGAAVVLKYHRQVVSGRRGDEG